MRLTQGRADQETIYAENPADVAAEFPRAGSAWVHVVDLDGAFAGEPQNLAAVQAIRARSPAVIETNWAGANAGALALGKRSDITARSELGLQLDADTLLGGVPVTGYVRAAWAHYFRRDADLTASLIGLPGASFTATGAQLDRNSALVSAGITARLSERVTLGLNLDGELSANGNRIGGAAQIRVSF